MSTMEDTSKLNGEDEGAIFLDSKRKELSKLCLQPASAEVKESPQPIPLPVIIKEKAGKIILIKSKEDLESLLLLSKRSDGPAGGILDNSKVSIDDINNIKAIKAMKACKLVPEKDVQFIESQVKGRVLGGGKFCKEVVEVIDSKLETVKAVKTIGLPGYNENQIKAWYLLADQSLAPKLYAFYRDNDIFTMIMEIIEGKTLKDVENHKLIENPDLAIALAIVVLEGLLTAFQALIKGKFIHGDMHAGNIMIQPETGDNHLPQIKIKLIDFDLAKIRQQQSMKDDLLRILGMFSHLYSSYDLINNTNAETILKSGRLEEVNEFRTDLTEKQRQELFEILTLLFNCVRDSNQENYGDTLKVSNYINQKYPIGTFKEKIALILFPEHFQQQAGEVNDACDLEEVTGLPSLRVVIKENQ